MRRSLHRPLDPIWILCFLVPGALAQGSGDDSDPGSLRDIVLIVAITVLLLMSLWLVRAIYWLWHDHHAAVSNFKTPGEVLDEASTGVDGRNRARIEWEDLEVGEPIGKGVNGKVYRARWRGLTVAVKEMVHSAKEEHITQELATLSKVRHPSLVLFMGISQPGLGRLCIVSEYMARGSLFSVLHDRTIKLDWRQRIGLALDTARALSYLHTCRPPILHKQLTSLNVLVDKDLVAKVSDYGLDRLRGLARKNGMTQPFWLAPEVIRKNRYSAASDVYSFGIVLWETVTRRTPYEGQLALSIADNIKALKEISSGLRPIVPPGCPTALSTLMQRCWDADPGKRPSFEDIVTELSQLEKLKVDVSTFAPDDVQVKVDTAVALEAKERKEWMVGWDEIKLERMIGHGSFGEVWLGLFRGKKVAVKKLPAAGVKQQLRQFVHELSIMHQLRSPNCVLFMGACLDEGRQCILMEYCEKGNLFELLHDVSQPIDFNLILKVLTQVAEGVLYLHSSSPPILHRDLKSLNILVDEYWNCKVSDFGLTHFKTDAEKQHGLQIGTPFWMAPECLERADFTEASDVYSFGMIVWEMFTRQTPFSSMTPHQAILAVLTQDKRPDIPLYVPPGFQQLIAQCWHRDPRKRPSFAQILQALAKLKEEGLPRLDLSLDNARLYRKKTTVYAFPSKDTVIVYKPWGTGEGKKGDWVVVGPNDDVYTCDADIFRKTYARVDGRSHLYRKTGKIFALEMKRDFLIKTLEGMEHGTKGDFLAQNPADGEQWPIARKAFLEMYELAPDQTLDEEDRKAVVIEEVERAARIFEAHVEPSSQHQVARIDSLSSGPQSGQMPQRQETRSGLALVSVVPGEAAD